ncbi:MAG: hypothetical protein AAFZ80_13265 [Cyanobacteria bacterium P01_A01_bin.105]
MRQPFLRCQVCPDGRLYLSDSPPDLPPPGLPAEFSLASSPSDAVRAKSRLLRQE